MTRTIIKLSLSSTLALAIFLPLVAFMNKVEDDHPPKLATKIQLLVDHAKVSFSLYR